jgi:CubicO group peptidase (beta-lactamase class C family)
MNKTTGFIALFLFFSLSIVAQKGKKIDLAEIDRYYVKMVQDWDLPGASIGIVKDGKLVFVGNYGTKEAGKTEKPDENTLYAIASNSKAFTSAILGMLVQEGKLKWNDKVKQHLPYFALFDTWVSNEANIRDILSHRVGLGTFSGDVIWYKSDLSAEEMIKRIKFVPKAYDFRAGYGYSNLMYITAGELIKKVSGKTWGENVKERIFVPLGMDRSITSIKQLEETKNYATPHARADEKNYPIPWANWDEVGATGGIISSVKDISKWMIFNMNHGIVNQDTLLRKETLNLAWTPHNNFVVDHTTKNPLGRHFRGYGLGWDISDYHGKFMIGHTGGYDGMISAITMIPEENLGVVVLTNGVKSPIMAATYYALDKFTGLGNKDWSADMLKNVNDWQKRDTRISDRKQKRIEGTKPSLPLEKYAGTYKSDMYGEIRVVLEGQQFRLEWEHSPLLSAKLTHWHYDVWEIAWEHPQAWFSFGTVKFNTDNNMQIIGMDLDIPNDDFFFEELKPYRVK